VSTAALALPDRELVLDRYRPLRPLGRGGSASVWLARDERSGLEVALKIVPREGKRAARAMREMEAASRLRHERCVRAYGFGGDDDHVYIAYEYVDGSTLRDLLRQGLVHDRDALEIAAQVLEGLAHAHRIGIVHRDVKPSNVLVENGSQVSARLVDFGLAQFDDADTLTAVGDVPGTLAYIPPERLRGEDATTRSDVWAVGVMLWEALAGQHPFWGVPLPQVASTIEAGAPPLQAQRPDLPRRVVAAVGAALATDPKRRPSAARLAEELREGWLATRTARTRRDATKGPRPTGRSSKKPTIVTTIPPALRLASAGLVTLTAAAGALLLPFWPQPLGVTLALVAGLLTLRWPRLGLGLALFMPMLPLGNEARAAAVCWAAAAAVWLALSWRRPYAGIAFATGPVLAAAGLLALVPLAVQPVRPTALRALHAAVAVLAAALVAGLRGTPLPLTGDVVGNLGIAASERPADVVQAVFGVLESNMAIVTTALALALVAAFLPRATARGLWGIAALGAFQIALVLLWAPTIPAFGVIAGTWLVCVVLAARPLLELARPAVGVVRGGS
jgi:eukaryotic-like serine/threonine-protein kinase